MKILLENMGYSQKRNEDMPKQPETHPETTAQESDAAASQSSSANQSGSSSPNLASNRHGTFASRTVQSSETRSGNHQALLQQLKFQKVPGDDHCLFHAIGAHLGQDFFELRQKVADHMELPNNFERFHAFDDEERNEVGFRRYIEKIRSGREWPGQMEIVALQEIKQRPIIIIRSDENPTIPDNIDDYPGEPIFVYYNDNDHASGKGDHYDSFIMAEDADPREILTAIQSLLAENIGVVCNGKTLEARVEEAVAAFTQ